MTSLPGLLCAVLLATGCTLPDSVADDDAGDSPRDGSTSPVLGSDAGSFPSDPSVLRISLTAERAELCAGECTMVHALGEGGRAPYVFTWSDPVLSGSEVRVCPTRDTTYGLTLLDSPSGGVEFSAPAQVAQASIALVVRDCTVQEPPVRMPPSEACRLEITSAPGTSDRPESVRVGMLAMTAPDPQGGVLVAGSFLGRLKLEPSSVPTTLAEPHRHFLAKYDAGCRLLWSQFQGDSGVEVVIQDVASDVFGNFAVVTSWTPVTASGAAQTGQQELHVSKLRNDGTSLYARRFSGVAWPYSLRMNARGELAFVAYAGNDYGVPRVGTADGAFDVVKLAPDGQVVFVHGSAPYTTGGSAALLDDGTVYYGGIRNWGNPPYTDELGTLFVSNLGTDGVARWEVTRAQQPSGPFFPNNSFLSVDSRGGLVLAFAEFPGNATENTATTWFLAPDTSTRALTTQRMGPSGGLYSNFAAVDDVLLLTHPVWPAPGTSGDGLGRQLITARSSDGSVVWSHLRTGEMNEYLMDLSASPRQLVLTSQVERPTPAQANRLIVSRLVFPGP